ncbi:MAG: thioesterase family protein [Bacteroidetes bacterium]|nr:thioesterase family protein [Bacteroidota bacterium]
MESYTLPIQIRWSDIDANNHLRHSAFYDYGAWIRIVFLAAQGIDMQWMKANENGPILFREEALFKREIRFEDKVTINVEITKATGDYSRWSLRHSFVKEDGTLAAIINVDGAWFSTAERKLIVPGAELVQAFDAFPKAQEFEWTEKSKKQV